MIYFIAVISISFIAKFFHIINLLSNTYKFYRYLVFFYNSYYHLSTESSIKRSELLAKDILAQFAKEK